MSNQFIAIDDMSTRYDAEINYIKFNGFMVKAMVFLFPGMFKRQVQKWLNQFKSFAEGRGLVDS